MRKIIVVPYDDRWPEMFEAESLLIKHCSVEWLRMSIILEARQFLVSQQSP